MKMTVNIIIDSTLKVDSNHLQQLLDKYVKFLSFKVSNVELTWDEDCISHPFTHNDIRESLSEEERNSYQNFIFTTLSYDDSFYFKAFGNIVPFSMAHWKHLTELPESNGILYFIIAYLFREINESEFRHDENVGCIYDFLWKKKGIDVGMRKAYLCIDCLKRLKSQKLTEEQENILIDLESLIDVLSNHSKWNRDILSNSDLEINSVPEKRQPKKQGEINVAIASPGDTSEEREILLNTLERKFRTDQLEDSCGFRLKIHGWEDLSSQNGYAQNVINDKIIHNMDIVLAVFKHKLGTPTINISNGKVRAQSGTAEEILFALDSSDINSPIGMTYFYSEAPSLPFDNSKFEDSLNNWKTLVEFKKSIQNKVIYKPYSEPQELLNSVCRDLHINIKDLFEK